MRVLSSLWFLKTNDRLKCLFVVISGHDFRFAPIFLAIPEGDYGVGRPEVDPK